MVEEEGEKTNNGYYIQHTVFKKEASTFIFVN